MNINKRVFIESIIVSIVIIIAVLGFNIVQGMLLTRNYVPDVTNGYASVDYLQHKVEFGIVNRLDWLTIVFGFSGILLLAMTYYVLRMKLSQFSTKKHKN
ncbi:cytochrome b6 [compost metagenome]